MSRKPMKHGDVTIPVPEEQVVIYQQCESCRQNMPLDQFDRRGRWRDGQKPTDSMCKGCRDVQARETKKYVRRNAKRIDDMQLRLMEALADETPEDFGDDLPNIGTLTQAVLRPFGGAQGLGLQIASSYLSSPPGSACRQKTHSLLAKMVGESSKLGYTKKTAEQMNDDELAEWLAKQKQKLLKQADDEDVEEKADEEVEATQPTA